MPSAKKISSTKTARRKISTVMAALVGANVALVAIPYESAIAKPHKPVVGKQIDTTSLAALCGIASSFCRNDQAALNYQKFSMADEKNNPYSNLTNDGQHKWDTFNQPITQRISDIFHARRWADMDDVKTLTDIETKNLDRNKARVETGVRFHQLPAYLNKQLGMGHAAPFYAITESVDAAQAEVIKLINKVSDNGILPKDGYAVFMRKGDNDTCTVFHFGKQNADAKLNTMAAKGTGCQPFFNAVKKEQYIKWAAKVKLERQAKLAQQQAKLAHDIIARQQQLIKQKGIEAHASEDQIYYENQFKNYFENQFKIDYENKFKMKLTNLQLSTIQQLLLVGFNDPASFKTMPAAPADRIFIESTLKTLGPIEADPIKKAALISTLAQAIGLPLLPVEKLANNPMVISPNDFVALATRKMSPVAVYMAGLHNMADQTVAQQAKTAKAHKSQTAVAALPAASGNNGPTSPKRDIFERIAAEIAKALLPLPGESSATVSDSKPVDAAASHGKGTLSSRFNITIYRVWETVAALLLAANVGGEIINAVGRNAEKIRRRTLAALSTAAALVLRGKNKLSAPKKALNQASKNAALKKQAKKDKQVAQKVAARGRAEPVFNIPGQLPKNQLSNAPIAAPAVPGQERDELIFASFAPPVELLPRKVNAAAEAVKALAQQIDAKPPTSDSIEDEISRLFAHRDEVKAPVAKEFAVAAKATLAKAPLLLTYQPQPVKAPAKLVAPAISEMDKAINNLYEEWLRIGKGLVAHGYKNVAIKDEGIRPGVYFEYTHKRQNADGTTTDVVCKGRVKNVKNPTAAAETLKAA